MTLRGIRGATTVEDNNPEQIAKATQELLCALLDANPGLRTDDIASAIFTTTDDLVSAYPALAARQIGWDHVPMMCAREIPVPDGLPHCIRVLVHWNSDRDQEEIHHVYLREAVTLRPDLSLASAEASPKE
jgi:chorismate mutase